MNNLLYNRGDLSEPTLQARQHFNWLYAQLHYFLNFSQLLVPCLSLLDKLD